jgi:hypothetical protein
MSTKNNWGNYTQSQVITDPKYTAFVSYATPVIIIKDGEALEVNVKFSRTTSKQITTFKQRGGKWLDTKLIDRKTFLKIAQDLGLHTGRLDNWYWGD